MRSSVLSGRFSRIAGTGQVPRGMLGGFVPLVALTLMLLLVVTGCFDQGKPAVKRYPVRGSVTLDGSLLPDGRVSFITLAAGRADALAIKDGHFEGEAEAGERRVEFSFVKNVTASGPPIPGMPETVPQESLPAHCNSESKYKVTVVSDGVNEFIFDLKSTAR
jgi:hypothetical protein